MHPRAALGITAGDRPGLARLGVELETLGCEELWVNDTRRGDGLATLAAIAPATPRLRLAVGVVALSDFTPDRVAERVRATSISGDRLTIGLGSGASASLELVRQGVAAVRRLLPGYPVAVAAVGPRMARLAGEVADAVVGGWALPERLAELREIVLEGAEDAGRSPPRLVAYVRTAIGRGAAARLQAEMDQYARYGPHYARAFAAQRATLVGVALETADPAALAEALEPYRSVVDTLVVRGVPAADTVDGWLEVARLATIGLEGDS